MTVFLLTDTGRAVDRGVVGAVRNPCAMKILTNWPFAHARLKAYLLPPVCGGSLLVLVLFLFHESIL